METALQLHPVRQNLIPLPVSPILPASDHAEEEPLKPFVEANTKAVTLRHLQEDCVVPVFSKDNEVTISHPAFVETVYEAAQEFFRGESIDSHEIRVSHIIKGESPKLSISP